MWEMETSSGCIRMAASHLKIVADRGLLRPTNVFLPTARCHHTFPILHRHSYRRPAPRITDARSIFSASKSCVAPNPLNPKHNNAFTGHQTITVPLGGRDSDLPDFRYSC